MSEPTGFKQRYYTAQDGLRLAYRDYDLRDDVGPPRPPAASGVTLLCLAGLARNGVDFDDLALRLRAKHRVLVPDYRGRGLSAHDPDPNNYQPATYLLDIAHLLTLTNCHRIVVIGTSMGGLLGMALAASRPGALAGLVMNDIGPEINPDGVTRIRGYVGKEPNFPNLDAGIQYLRQGFEGTYPDFSDDDWERLARRNFLINDDGTLRHPYDPAIRASLNSEDIDPAMLWGYFSGLDAIPTLVFRGDRSDILSAQTVAEMKARKPDLMAVTVPDRGHAPELIEPICVSALNSFLAPFEGSQHHA